MMMPSIFGENLFDDFMNDSFDNLFRIEKNPIFGKREKNLLKTDVKDNGTSYELDMDLPGFKKEEISAKLENGYLTVSAARGVEKEQKDEKGSFIRQERYSGSCSRSFYVGETVKQEEIKARFEDGVLHLQIPKEDQTQVEEKKYIAIEG